VLIVVVDTSHVLMTLVVRHVLVRISFHISHIICELCDRICGDGSLSSLFPFFPFHIQSLPFTSSPSNHDLSFLFTFPSNRETLLDHRGTDTTLPITKGNAFKTKRFDG